MLMVVSSRGIVLSLDKLLWLQHSLFSGNSTPIYLVKLLLLALCAVKVDRQNLDEANLEFNWTQLRAQVQLSSATRTFYYQPREAHLH